MSHEPEWAINPAGEVMMVISPPLPHAPSDGRLTPRGRFLIGTEGAESRAYAPNPKVMRAIRRQETVLVVEMAGPNRVLRTTRVPTGTAAPAPTMGNA